MREIKFRAWDKENKNMFGVKSIHFENFIVRLESLEFYLMHDVVLMQSTGLKDKNGVEIYEGDVVENNKGETGYVVFLMQEAGFVVVLKNSDYRLGHRNTGEVYTIAHKHRVIGNIHENLELLEVDEHD